MHVQLEDPTALTESSCDSSPAVSTVVSRSSSVRIAILVFAVFQCFYLLSSSGRARTADEYNTLYMTESLVLRGSTAIPQAVQLHNFFGKTDLQGQPRAAYPPGQAILSTPWHALGYYVVSRLPGVPANVADLVTDCAVCLSSATFAALTVAFLFAFLSGIGIPARASLFASVMLGVSTPIFGYSAWLFSEALSTAIFLGVALLLFGRARRPISIRSAAVAGLVLGMAAWVRPTNAMAIAIFGIAVLVRDRRTAWKPALILCATAALGVLALLSRNDLLFGSPFDFGYPKLVDYGINVDVRFDTPLSIGLYGLLLSPGKSVFLFAPPIILALAGLRRLWKLERGAAALAIFFPLVYLAFFSRYSSWEGGYCAGPRYLVPAIALLCLGLGPVLATGKAVVKKAAWLLLVLGSAVQTLTLATSFLEDQAPRGHYYDATWHYRLDYSLRGPIHLFWKYLTTGQPARLGSGWDRWFVFLHLAGVSTGTIAAILLLMLTGFAVSLSLLVKSVRVASQA